MLENVPILYSSVVIAGLKYPIVAASLLAVYTFTRVPYTLGYKTGVADNVCVVTFPPLFSKLMYSIRQRNALGPIKLGVPILASLAQMCKFMLFSDMSGRSVLTSPIKQRCFCFLAGLRSSCSSSDVDFLLSGVGTLNIKFACPSV